MTLVLNGSVGVSDVDGSAATPAIRGTDSNTGMFFPAADTIAFAEGGSEVMRIDSAGNLGVGTSSPSARLDISNVSRYTFNIANAYTLQTSINAAGSAFADDYKNAAQHIWQTSGTERARIDSSGNFIFGATSSWTPPAGTSAKTFNNNGYAVGNSSTSANFTNDRIVFNGGQYYVLNGSSTGVVLTSGNTSWSAQSDERLKDIVEPISNAVEKVSTLRSVIGKYKTDENEKRRAFLLAQDVKAVLPEAVTTGEDGYLLLGYTETIPLLVAAIQELKAQNDELKARVEALETK